MQQETPQVDQPAPQMPPQSAPPTPPKPEPAADHGAAFYQPATAPTYNAVPTHESHSPIHHDPGAPLRWEASEYVHIDKGANWLVGFGLIVAVMLAIAVWLSAWTFAVLILVMAVAMGVFAFRRPHTLQYTLTNDGITIGQQTFHYSDFRAFGILQDGAFFTMTLIPIKRFAPALSVYFAEDQGEQIVDVVGGHLPMENIHPDFIDRLMRRLRF